MIMEFIVEHSKALTVGTIGLNLVSATWFARSASRKTRERHYYEGLILQWEPPKYEEPVVEFTTRRTRSGRPVQGAVS